MSKKVIAITSCPVGVAHTYMAAENLEKAASNMGIDIKVETHGSIGIENELTDKEIQEAEGLIIAADTNIDRSRFSGKQILQVGVQEGIRHPEELIQKILNHEADVYYPKEDSSTKSTHNGKSGGNVLYRSLMNGVSYMVPFVVTGGLLIAIALSIGGEPTSGGFVVPEGTIWESILNIGGAAMGFMVPILSGYIAYSIADRPGLVPGIVGGFIAVNGSFYGSEANTGFIGGIIAGFLAGYIALAIKKIKVPKAMQSVMPIIFIPVISSVIVGLLFIYLIGLPVSNLFVGLTNWLSGLEGANSALLATIIGAMIAFDMGGPFNKVAFLFGAGMIAEGKYSIMGSVAVAVCIPPIALGIASHILPKKFDEGDKQAGKAAFAMGLFGITEGAIPFAAKDPLKVIPSIIGGSIVGSIIAMLSKVGGHVAHGGPIVALLGAIDNVLMFFVAVIAGVAVTIGLLFLLKKDLPVVKTYSDSNRHHSKNDHGEPITVEQKSPALIDLMDKDLFNMDLSSKSKQDAIAEILNHPAVSTSLSGNTDKIIEAVYARESEGTTGMGSSVAIPHAKTDHVTNAQVLFARSKEGIDWESLDGEPAKLIFMILVPKEAAGDMHLKILQMLARKLVDEEFINGLLNAETKEEIYNILKDIR